MKKPDLSIILPCYNESRNISVVVERLSKFWPGINFELIMVNNGSTDNTSEVLEGLANDNEFLRIVTIEKNIGYGHGIMQGLQQAGADILTYSHADIQTPPEDIFKAFDMLQTNGHNPEEVLIKGMRTNRRKDEQSLSSGLEKVCSLIMGYPMRDINGQPKMFHRNLLYSLKQPPTNFSFDVYVMFKAIQKKLEIKTFPVDFGLRLHGKSKWASSPIKKYRTIFGYLWSILLISLKNIGDDNNPIKQFVKFCIVGSLGASVNYGIFYLCYKAFSVYYVASSLIGFFVAAAVIFLINRNWTFSIRHGHISKQFVSFILLISFSFVANGLSIYTLVNLCHIKVEISQLITMIITTMINFLGSKFLVFQKPKQIK